MGFISSIPEKKVSITFYSKDVSVIDGVPQPESWTESETVEGLFWTGTQNLTFVSDKLKTQVEGAIAVDYNSTIAALPDDSKFTVNGKNYEIIHIDNSGEQDEALIIMYKRKSSN